MELVQRGRFTSYSGFSQDGCFAFGRGKKLICMDGRDIYETLSRSIPLYDVIVEKARHAASRGRVFQAGERDVIRTDFTLAHRPKPSRSAWRRDL